VVRELLEDTGWFPRAKTARGQQVSKKLFVPEIVMRYLSALLLALAAATPAFADPFGVPEIDAASGVGAIALLAGVLALVKENRRK
jgi:hypothetical protein